MKQILNITIITFFLFTGVCAMAMDDINLIKPEKVGLASIGMSEPDLRTMYKDYPLTQKIIKKGQTKNKIITIFLHEPGKSGNQPSMKINMNNGKIYIIEVCDPKLKTAKGIGVGTNIATLLKTYKADRIVSDGGDWPIVMVDNLGMSFIIDANGYKGKQTRIKPEDLPKGAKIRTIIVSKLMD